MAAKITGMEVITLRLPRPLLERVDAFVKRLANDEQWTLRGMDTRAQVMREAIIQGLVVLEESAKKR